MHLFERIRKRNSLWFLNIAQWGAVVNDNIYKFILVFLLIDVYGSEKASNILSGAGAVFVIPFLLFSSAAGILADRYSKKWIITLVKIFEVMIFLGAVYAVKYHNPYALYFFLFCLATHSAIFGPAKYSIIPELVPAEKVPKANGLITSCTYLGIIIGTFLASFLSEITNCQYTTVIFFCCLLAVFGLLNALCMTSTPPQGSQRKIHAFFIKEIFHTLRSCRTKPYLLLVLASSSFFLFVGAFTQLNIIPYSLQGLHLSEIYGGYLFLCTALGIAGGSYLVGKILKRPIALWIPCMAGFTLAFFLFCLAFISNYLPLTIALLFFLGVAGGMFVVPLDSFIQLACSHETRGQVIAAGNFLGFCGVLLSSILLYVLSSVLGLSAMVGFGIMAVLTLAYTIFLFFQLSAFTLPFLVKAILRPAFKLELTDLTLLEPETQMPLVVKRGTVSDCLLLTTLLPHYRFVIMGEKKSLSTSLLSLFATFSFSTLPDEVMQANTRVCFVIPDKWPSSWLPRKYAQVELLPSYQQGPMLVRFILPS